MRIGLLLGVFSSSYCLRAVDCIAQEIEKRHGHLVIFEGCSLENNTSYNYMQNVIFRLIHQERLDGLIILSGTLIFHGGKDLIEQFSRKADIPIVSMGLPLEGICSVMPDNASGIAKIMSHLASHSCNKFAYIGGASVHPDFITRRDTFLRIIKEKGLQAPPNLIFEATYGFRSAYNHAKGLIPYVKDKSIDAVVCSNDEMALAVVRCFTQHGLRIPEDVAVTGFDGSESLAFSSPSLTTIDLDVGILSKKTVSVLFELIFSRKSLQTYSIEPKLLVGQSCGCTAEALEKNGTGFPYPEAHYLNGKLQSLDITDFFAELTRYLDENNVSQCYIVRYTEPVPFNVTSRENNPPKALLFYGYFKGYRISHSKAFPAADMLPDHILDKISESVLVKPLYFGKLQFGFLLISATAEAGLIDDLGQEFCHCLESLSINEERALLEKKLADAHESLMISNKRLNELMVKENLDKLSNLRYLAANMLQNRKTGKGEYILIIVEIDNLADINSRFGFNEGEYAMAGVSDVLSSSIREDDFLSQQSGERYVILVKNIQNDPIRTIEKRFNQGFSEMNKSLVKGYSVKLSWGSSYADTDADFDYVYQQAEKSLMECKKNKYQQNV